MRSDSVKNMSAASVPVPACTVHEPELTPRSPEIPDNQNRSSQ
jgi:hypothetical protein